MRRNILTELTGFKAERYTDGVHDVWGIFEEGCSDPITEIRFWDEPDSEAAKQAEEIARLFASSLEMIDALLVAHASLVLWNRQTYLESPMCEKIHTAIERAAGCHGVFGRTSHLSRGRFPKRAVRAIEKVLGHFYPDEEQDFLSAGRRGRAKHIFRDLLTLKNAIEQFRAARGSRETERDV